MNPQSNHPAPASHFDMFNTAHGQQVLSTNGAIFHFPEEPSSRKRPREIVDHIPLQQQRPSLINLSDLQQQTGPGIVSHSARTVSTGLRLAFEDEQVNSSTKFAPRVDLASTMPFLSEDITSNLQKQKEEIDQFLRVQGDQLRQALAEKRHRHFRSLLSMIEEAASRQMKEKDLEMEKINLRNMELEEQIKQLKLESCMWQNKVRNQEAVMANLRRSLQQALGQVREQSKEGCGDSEENDAESVHIDPNVRSLRASKDLRDQSTCKVCHKNSVSILLLPCRHLCICKDCDVQVDTCPLCYHMKNASVEVYMS